ncbi:hypothetical protein [Methanobacterium sp.]|uniref:hypothetical protein n=1 Tax=Methanobacterium sp. TaxID=2164 RepID=UPI003C7392B8
MAVRGYGSNVFGIIWLNKIKNQVNVPLNKLVMYYNSTLKNNGTDYVSERPVIFNDIKRYDITVKSSGNYFSGVLFIKNSTAYLALLNLLIMIRNCLIK